MVLTIHFASINPGKQRSLQQKLQQLGIEVILEPIELKESRSKDPTVIAKEKAVEAFQRIRRPVIALDAGFFIPALNGFPGTQTNHALETIGIEGILDLMVRKRDRQCEFRHALAYLDGFLHEPKVFLRTVGGNLAEEPSAESIPTAWSVLARIFVPHGCCQVEALLTPEERSYLSRRTGGYYHQFAKWLKVHTLKQRRNQVEQSA